MVERTAGCLSLLLAAGILAGCAGGDAGDRVAAPSATAPPGPDEEQRARNPLDLIGSWLVTEADEEPGVVLRIAGDITLWRACGVQMGQWEVERGGLFVAGMDSWTGECSDAQRRTAWLDRSTSYRITDTGVLLAGADGSLRAHLVPGGHPTPHPNVSPELADPPEVTGRDRSYRVRPAPAPLPEGVLPATREQLIGRWIPDAGSGLETRGPTYVELGADGHWRGSHGEGPGCPSAGRWVVGSDGRVLSTMGPVPLVFCPGSTWPTGSWMPPGPGSSSRRWTSSYSSTPQEPIRAGSRERRDGPRRTEAELSGWVGRNQPRPVSGCPPQALAATPVRCWTQLSGRRR